MIVNVCFVKRPNLFWWDYLLGEYKHCFLCVMDTKLMIYDFKLAGMMIDEATDDDFIDVEEVIQFEVNEMCTGKYRPLLTCADFCASLLGIKGLIITPCRLKEKLYGWKSKSAINSTSRIRSKEKVISTTKNIVTRDKRRNLR